MEFRAKRRERSDFIISSRAQSAKHAGLSQLQNSMLHKSINKELKHEDFSRRRRRQ